MNLGDAAVGPPVGRRMKARAPPPPRPPQPAPRKIFRNAVPDGGGSSGGESKENILQSTVDLHITLPAGYQTTISVDGRKALMDLLVDLCSQYHLNPADHTLELLSPDAQPVSYKPNALLGALDVSCALIKQRVLEDKVVRKPPPKVPEKTVRLVVNYHRNQKAVVRVNPMVPLRALVPVICQKCEFDPAHVLLLKDNINNHELDLDKTLSDQDIRELYALDQAIVLQPKMASTPALNYSAESLHSNSLSGSEKKGLLGFLKFNRRKSKTEDQFSEDMDSPDDDSVVENADTNVNGMASGPCVETRPSTLGQSQSVMNISRMSPKVELKKRRAPAPPSALTQTLPLVSQRSLGSPSSHNLLKKRKAPPPPPSPTPSTPEPVIHTPVPTAPVCAPSISMPTERTMMPPANTTGPADDSQSDLSHSIEDSEPAGSICSSSSGEDVAAESSASSLAEEPVADQATGIAAYTISTPEPDIAPECMEEPAPHVTLEKQPGPSPKSEDLESALELKMEEMENNRNSGIGWLHSAHESVLEKTVEQEVETVSVASSESFADQGYAASEGMAEEPSLASTSERIQSASPVDIVSLNSGSGPAIKQSKDSSSDSDEGCATWGSRHSSRNIQSGHKPVKELNSYEEDPEITAQIHLTLADLDANLADINQSDGAPIFVDDEIPVSIVDVDIPVTTIDEVPDDDRCSMSEYKAPLLHSTQNIISHSCTPCEAIQNKNKNNNVCLTEEKTVNPSRAAYKQLQEPRLTDIKKNVSQSPASQKQSLETKLRNGEKNVSLSPVIQKQLQFAKFTDTKEQNVTMTSDNKDKAGTQELKVQKDSVSPKSQSPVVCPTVQSVQKADDRQKFVPVVQMPRTETANEDRTPITRVPPTQGKITKNPVSRFGMKTFTVIPPKPTVSQTHKPAGSLVIGAIKIDEQGNMVTRRQITTAPEKHSSHEEVTCGTKSPLGQAKAFWSSAEKQDQATMTNQGSMMKGKDTDVFEPPLVSGVSKLSVKSHPEEKPKEIIILEKNPISVVGSNLSFQEPKEKHSLTGERRDLPFLKPFRKTSSQYVASAIAKNNSIQNTKTDSIQEPSQSTVHIKKLPLNQQINNDIRPINTLSEGPTKPVKTFKASESSMPVVGGPKHSQSYPSHVAEKLESPEKISSLVKGTLHGGTKSLDSHTINNEITSFNKFPNTTSSQHTPKHNTGLPLTKKPEVHKSEIASEPNMFGPVKKFKPVIFQPVQKDTSLHSSLMEAIQSGGGIERLRKVSDSSSSSTVKKPSYTDSENQLSALLSAIRAPSNSARLRKTISGASKELEQLRQAEENRNVQKEITAPPPTSPPAFEALSPPAFSPPPPPPLAPAKPPPVLPAGGNPEAAREALLEAIRSGSGAQRLRKVPVTQKRRQVNGRLRTIQATSPLSHGH